jgi:hypothetical protein
MEINNLCACNLSRATEKDRQIIQCAGAATGAHRDGSNFREIQLLCPSMNNVMFTEGERNLSSPTLVIAF